MPHRHDNHSHEDPAVHWNERYSGAQKTWSGNPNAALIDCLVDLAPGSALELACGEGDDAIWLAERGWQVTAIDVSTKAIERARATAESRGITSITWLVADLNNWSPERSYDLVTSSFFHSPTALDRDGVLRRAASAVAPGGHVFALAHGTPPPWSHRAKLKDPGLPTLEEELAALRHPEERWDTVIAEHRMRPATGPDGQEAELDDVVVLLKRRD